MDTESPSPLNVVFDNRLSRSASDRRGRCVVSSSLSSTTFGLIGAITGETLAARPLMIDRSFSETAGEVTVGMYH